MKRFNMDEMLTTSDIGQITALIVRGFTPRDKFRDGKRVFFVFDMTNDIAEAVEAYENRNLLVDAQTFLINLRAVRTSIYDVE